MADNFTNLSLVKAQVGVEIEEYNLEAATLALGWRRKRRIQVQIARRRADEYSLPRFQHSGVVPAVGHERRHQLVLKARDASVHSEAQLNVEQDRAGCAHPRQCIVRQRNRHWRVIVTVHLLCYPRTLASGVIAPTLRQLLAEAGTEERRQEG